MLDTDWLSGCDHVLKLTVEFCILTNPIRHAYRQLP